MASSTTRLRMDCGNGSDERGNDQSQAEKNGAPDGERHLHLNPVFAGGFGIDLGKRLLLRGHSCPAFDYSVESLRLVDRADAIVCEHPADLPVWIDLGPFQLVVLR